MRDDRPGQPLARRVPGATNAGPALPAQRPLPDEVVERMRAAVDAAHAAQASQAALAACDLVLHQADEPRPAASEQPSAAAPGHRRTRTGLGLLRLWR